MAPSLPARYWMYLLNLGFSTSNYLTWYGLVQHGLVPFIVRAHGFGEAAQVRCSDP